MHNQPTTNNAQPQSIVVSPMNHCGGLPVRTNLRAGLAWDDLDDQAVSLFNKLKDAVAGAAQNVSDAVKNAGTS